MNTTLGAPWATLTGRARESLTDSSAVDATGCQLCAWRTSMNTNTTTRAGQKQQPLVTYGVSMNKQFPIIIIPLYTWGLGTRVGYLTMENGGGGLMSVREGITRFILIVDINTPYSSLMFEQLALLTSSL